MLLRFLLIVLMVLSHLRRIRLVTQIWLTQLQLQVGTSIKYVNVLARNFVKMKNPDISAKDLEAVVVFNDTDSCCIRLDKCGVKLCDGDKSTPEGYALVQNVMITLIRGIPKGGLLH